MSQTYLAEPTAPSIDARTHLRHSVSWGAIFAGVAAAAVVQVLLNLLGIGIGAASLDAANLSDNPSGATASMSAALWIGITALIASFIGGLVAGRLSGTSDTNTARWHGFVSWSATTLLMFYLLTTAVGGIIGGTFSALGSTIGAAGKGAASAVSGVAQNTNGSALQDKVRQLVNPNAAQTAQDNVLSYIRDSVDGNQQAADAARDRAVDSLAHTANISPDDAKARLQQATDQAKQVATQAKQKAQEAAEATRKAAASAGLYGFVGLLIGAIAAWIGGGIGAPKREIY